MLNNTFSHTFVPNLLSLAWKISPGRQKLIGPLNGSLCVYLMRQYRGAIKGCVVKRGSNDHCWIKRFRITLTLSESKSQGKYTVASLIRAYQYSLIPLRHGPKVQNMTYSTTLAEVEHNSDLWIIYFMPRSAGQRNRELIPLRPISK